MSERLRGPARRPLTGREAGAELARRVRLCRDLLALSVGMVRLRERASDGSASPASPAADWPQWVAERETLMSRVRAPARPAGASGLGAAVGCGRRLEQTAFDLMGGVLRRSKRVEQEMKAELARAMRRLARGGRAQTAQRSYDARASSRRLEGRG